MVAAIGIFISKMLMVLGILLLSLLILILILLLSLLFVPLRYQIRGKREAGEDQIWNMEGYLRISWFFGLIRGQMAYPDRLEFSWKLLGIPFKKSKAETGSKGKSEEASGEKASAGKNEATHANDETNTNDKASGSLKTNARGADAPRDGVTGAEAPTEGAAEADVSMGEAGAEESPRGWEKIGCTILNLCDKISGLSIKIRAFATKWSFYLELLTREETRILLEKVKKHGWKILVSILPRRLEGEITFGTGDPASTGYIWGMAVMALGGRWNHLQAEPDFDRALICGHIHMKGRIYGIILLINSLPLLLAPELRAVRRQLKNGGTKDVR